MAQKHLGVSATNSTDAVTKAYVDSGIATIANKTISGSSNTVTGVSGMLNSCQIATQGSETYTISGGTVTQIAGTTINGYSPQVGDRVLVITAPATSGTGSGYVNTVQPTNGIYRVTSNTTNISLARSYDMSGTENPTGKMVWVQSGSWSAQTLWYVDTPINSNTAFTWGTTSLSFTPVFGGNGNISIYALQSTIFELFGNTYRALLVQNAASTANQTLTLPAVTTDTIVSRTSTDTLTNKTISGSSNTITNLGSSVSSSGTYASLPAAGNAGRIYICTDDGLILRDNGSSWDIVEINNSVGMTVPPTSGWSTTTMGTATVAADKGGRLLTMPSAAGENFRIEYRTLSPTSNYTITAHLEYSFTDLTNYVRGGLVVRDSSSGKIIYFGPTYNGGFNIYVMSYVSPTVGDTLYSNRLVSSMQGLPNRYRIRDDGTTRYYEYSYNGFDWLLFYSHGRTTYITPDNYGWGGLNSSGTISYVRLRSLALT